MEEMYCPTCGGLWPKCEGKVPQELRNLPLYAENKQLIKRWDELLQRWRRQCAGIDIQRELEKAHNWETDNPTRRKKNKVQFLSNWMERAQERASRRPQTWEVTGRPVFQGVPPGVPPKDPYRSQLLREVQQYEGKTVGGKEIVHGGIRLSDGSGVVPWCRIPDHVLEFLRLQGEYA